MLSHYGTMSFSQVVESALGFARDGFPAYQLLHRTIGSPDRLANLQKYPDSARVYLPNGKPPALGSLFTQPDLARTLTLLVEAEQQALGQGQARAAALQAARDVFYKGDVARRMVQALQALGGLYTYEDFASIPRLWRSRSRRPTGGMSCSPIAPGPRASPCCRR